MTRSMTTLVLSPRYSEDSIALRKAAEKAGWKTIRLESWRIPAHLDLPNSVLYGEPYFCLAIAEQLSLTLLGPAIEWLPSIPEEYRLRDVQLRRLVEVRSLSEPRFVKPAGDKSFPPQVYQDGVRGDAADQLADETPVLMADPVKWKSEYRAFVLDREVRTVACYVRGGKITRKKKEQSWPAEGPDCEQAREFLRHFLADKRVQLPRAVVVDVGEISRRGWAVVEANEAWGSGIYGCDPARVLEVIERSTVAAAGSLESDRQ